MDFKQAVLTCVMDKKFNWHDRATRSEFWWFYLASIGINIAANILTIIPLLGSLVAIVVGIALNWLVAIAAIRRLHDTDRRGYWLFIPLGTLFLGVIPMAMGIADIQSGGSGTSYLVIGVIIMLSGFGYVLYLLAQPGTQGDNRFGPAPCLGECEAPADMAAPEAQDNLAAPSEMPQDNKEQK